MENKSVLLLALETEKDGDWDCAHSMVQKMEDPNAYWIHAYLHRKEGDLSNAGYWYNRAGKEMSNIPFNDEWKDIFTYIGGFD